MSLGEGTGYTTVGQEDTNNVLIYHAVYYTKVVQSMRYANDIVRIVMGYIAVIAWLVIL